MISKFPCNDNVLILSDFYELQQSLPVSHLSRVVRVPSHLDWELRE